MWKSDNELFADENPAIYRRGWRYSRHAGLYAPVCFSGNQAAGCEYGGGRPGNAVLESDVYETKSTSGKTAIGEKPFGIMFEALDALKENDVYITTGSSLRYALWGGLMSTRAMHLKAAGAVLDGYARDSAEILELKFPTFCHGTYAQDQGPRGKVIDFGVPIEFHGVRVNPGDIVFGDRDGLLIIPQVVEKEVITQALEKVATESEVRKAISDGMSTVQAFETFGVM